MRNSLGLSDSALSKRLTTLEEAGYVQIRKRFIGKRPRTSAKLTTKLAPAGRAAFEQHVAAPQEIVSRSGATILLANPYRRSSRFPCFRGGALTLVEKV